MADNFVANAGSGGSTFAADELAGAILLPRVKLQVGADGVGQDNWTPSFLLSGSSTNGTVVKASPGAIGFIVVTNTNAAVRYLKLYNSTTVSVGSTTQLAAIAIPGATTGAGFTIGFPGGLAFDTGICIGLTTGPTSGDSGAVAANEICVLLGFA